MNYYFNHYNTEYKFRIFTWNDQTYFGFQKTYSMFVPASYTMRIINNEIDWASINPFYIDKEFIEHANKFVKNMAFL